MMCNFDDFESQSPDLRVREVDLKISQILDGRNNEQPQRNLSQNLLNDDLITRFRPLIGDAVDDARVFLNSNDVYLLFRVDYDALNQPIYLMYNTKDKDLLQFLKIGLRRYITELQHNAQDGHTFMPDRDIKSLLDELEISARNHLAETPFRLRIAPARGTVLYDLNDHLHRVLKITAYDQEYVYKSDLNSVFKYINNPTEQLYSANGSINDIDRIFQYINIPENERLLFKVYLISCLLPIMQHPILNIYGPARSGKSLCTHVIKTLIDPSPSLFNRERLDIIREIESNYYSVIDNNLRMSNNELDILLNAISEENHLVNMGSRQPDVFYNNYPCVCIVSNTIAFERENLLQQSIHFEMQRIDQITDRQLLLNQFRDNQAAIFSGMVQALTDAMHSYNEYNFNEIGRMTDFDLYNFARWGYVIAEILEPDQGHEFISQYFENIRYQNLFIAQQDSFIELIIRFVNTREGWHGLASELYIDLTTFARTNGFPINADTLPGSASALSAKLNSNRDRLLARNINYQNARTNTGARIYLTSI